MVLRVTKAAYLTPEFLRNPEDIFSGVLLCRSNHWSAVKITAPFALEGSEIAVNIQDDDPFTTDAGKKTNSRKIVTFLQLERYVITVECFVKGGFPGVLACGLLTGDHSSAFAVNGSKYPIQGQLLDEIY